MESEAESGGDAFRGEATFDSVNERWVDDVFRIVWFCGVRPWRVGFVGCMSRLLGSRGPVS
jgi:hypothetical protein